MTTILALSGSLRAASVNTAFLRALQHAAQPPVTIHVYEQLGKLPLFNPDLETDPPQTVRDLYRHVADSQALVIASPEYAHGVSGVIKNALDWLVSSTVFPGKPVALINTSPRAHHAQAALRETLLTMSADIVEPACISVPMLGKTWDIDTMLSEPLIKQNIDLCLSALQAHSSLRQG